jgi:hypothetical protein
MPVEPSWQKYDLGRRCTEDTKCPRKMRMQRGVLMKNDVLEANHLGQIMCISHAERVQ